ncbi:sugar transporter SWEET1-like [Toxorhynchites rutilus septentrionalis]|uniref:sugar transporter SWEET1-like n=1 Tax=Toxorhynchites rutilus septentrionalis TaxID=329112 RepID=UPI00247AAC9A|nr:sugar transporter SWEET1-like [Toxorhynchites rutilus septentrionalis]
MESLSQVLQPYKELVGNVAGVVTVLQMFSGCFVCNDIRKKGTSDGFSPMPFIGGCSLTVLFLTHALLMGDPAMIKANVVGLAISATYAGIFLLFTPKRNRIGFWRQVAMCGVLTASLLLYAKLEDPTLVEDRFGMIVTVLLLLLIAQPLFGLPEIVRKKSTEGLPFAMIFSGTIVGFMWLLYGIILNNSFVIFQNLAALALSGVQLALFVIYPSKDLKKKEP